MRVLSGAAIVVVALWGPVVTTGAAQPLVRASTRQLRPTWQAPYGPPASAPGDATRRTADVTSGRLSIGRAAAPPGRPHAPGVRPAAAGSGTVVEQYQVNAQYRGGIKKGFRDIGRGRATYLALGGSRFSIRLEASVENPDNHEVFTMVVDMDFQASGPSIRATRNDSRYSANAVEYRDRVERVVPFVYLVKFTSMPVAGEEPSRLFRFKGVEYVMRYVPTEKHVEASLFEGDSLVGKFFLLKDGGRQPVLFEKFRVPTEGNVVLSFIRL
jgi:hypothetical protein